MKSLSRAGDRDELLARLRTLRPDASGKWGLMSVDQMVRHLGDAFLMMTGERQVSGATGLLQRTIIKWLALYAPLRWPPGLLTSPELDQTIGGTKPEEFSADVARVEAFLQRAAHATDCQTRPHPIFGRMSEADWMRWGYLHMDHHLRQFGK